MRKSARILATFHACHARVREISHFHPIRLNEELQVLKPLLGKDRRKQNHRICSLTTELLGLLVLMNVERVVS